MSESGCRRDKTPEYASTLPRAHPDFARIPSLGLHMGSERNWVGTWVPDINDKIAEWVEERENLDLVIIGLKLAGDSSSRKMENLVQVRSDLNDKIILTSQLA
jgi:hypothetical protein